MALRWGFVKVVDLPYRISSARIIKAVEVVWLKADPCPNLPELRRALKNQRLAPGFFQGNSGAKSADSFAYDECFQGCPFPSLTGVRFAFSTRILLWASLAPRISGWYFLVKG